MANTPLGFPFGFYVADNSPIDGKYGVLDAGGVWRPYADIAEALVKIPIGIRYIGLTININKVEYWWAEGVANGDLVAKATGGGGSGIAWKNPVKAATTANITLSAPQTIDGVSVIADDRVLVKNQTAQSENGIYVVAAGVWVRAVDADSEADFQNAVVSVDQGTVNADTTWRQNTDSVSVGSSNIVWVAFGSAGITGSTGPTDNAILRADGTGGSTLQSSTATITDGGKLQLSLDDPSTNTILYGQRITRTSGGAPAIGIGTGIEFEVETTSGNNETGAAIDAVVKDVTAGSENFDLDFNVMQDGAVRRKFAVRGSGFETLAAYNQNGAQTLQLVDGGALKIIDPTGASNHVTISVASGNPALIGVGVSGFSIISGGNPLYLESAVRIATGATGPPARQLHVVTNDSTINGVTYLLRLTHTAPGILATGMGTGLEFETGTSPSNNEVGATIEAVVTDVTLASEDFDLIFKTMAGGAAAAERVRINDKGLGVGVTPTARLTLAAGSAAANTAPLKLTSGTALTTPENGALEYHSSHLFFTIGSTRFQLDQQGSGISGLTANRIPYATSPTTLADDGYMIYDPTNHYVGLGGIFLYGTGSSINANNYIGNAFNFTTSGTGNIRIGQVSGSQVLSSGSNNLTIGHNSAFGLSTGSNNINLGHQAGDNLSTGSNNVIIGANAIDLISGTASNQLNIQNIIFGTGNSGTGTIASTGNIGIGVPAPTARLHLPAGSATANKAPLKLTTGVALTTPEDGAIEYHSSHLFFTIGSMRFQLDQQGGGLSGLTTNRIPYATGATSLGDDSALTWDPVNNTLNINAAGIRGTLNNLFFGNGAGNNTLSGDFNSAFGASSLAAITTGTGNVSIGVSAGIAITSGTQNTLIGFHAGDNLTTGGGNVVIGTNIGAPLAAGAFQLSIQNIIFGTNNNGSGTTVSPGNIGIGTPSPDRRFHVEIDDEVTSLVSYAQRLTHTTSGTPSSGIGTGLEFEVETSASNNEVGATIEAVATNVTLNSESFDLVLKTMSGGAAALERARFSSNTVMLRTGSQGLQIQQSDAGTGNVVSNIRIERSSSGTVTNGFGVQESVALQDSAGSVVNHSGTSYTWANATAGATDAKIQMIGFASIGVRTVYSWVGGNLGLLSDTNGFGGGVGVISVPFSATPPSSNPSSGFILSGAIGGAAFRGSGASSFHADSGFPSSVVNVLKLTHTTTGTPAIGTGASLQFEVETSPGNNEVGVSIEAVVQDVTATSEDFDLVFKTMGAGATATEKLRIGSDGSLGIGTTPSFGSGQRVVYIANAIAVPTSNPFAGGILYVEAGALKFRGSSGTVTTIANA